MAGMFKKLATSAIAAKVIQEARKPENQAKIKKAIADFQAKRSGQDPPPVTAQSTAPLPEKPGGGALSHVGAT